MKMSDMLKKPLENWIVKFKHIELDHHGSIVQAWLRWYVLLESATDFPLKYMHVWIYHIWDTQGLICEKRQTTFCTQICSIIVSSNLQHQVPSGYICVVQLIEIKWFKENWVWISLWSIKLWSKWLIEDDRASLACLLIFLCIYACIGWKICLLSYHLSLNLYLGKRMISIHDFPCVYRHKMNQNKRGLHIKNLRIIIYLPSFFRDYFYRDHGISIGSSITSLSPLDQSHNELKFFFGQ